MGSTPPGAAERPYRELSLWLDGVSDSLEPRPALGEDVVVDIAIIGGGFTGLWTAFYLKRADPTLRVAVLESEIAGFGASGRNGGWCSDLFPASSAKLARMAGAESARRMRQAMRSTIDEVEQVITELGLECGFRRGGTIAMARSAVQWQRAQADVESARIWGDADIRLLSAEEAQQHIGATNLFGASYTPHCAALDPGRLVRGLATAVAALGVPIYEQTTVTDVGRHVVRTNGGQVKAEAIIRATEAYTPQLPGSRRALVPIYSLITATEPLSEQQRAEVGLFDRSTFTDYRHLISYGQMTSDGRMVFGGRGAPYHFGSRTESRFDSEPKVHQSLQRTLRQMFPSLADVTFTHTWGGPLGVPRDWCASVGFDRESGFGWAGGYVGDGVSTANLAGRTLSDLMLEQKSELTTLPWVGHQSRRWEPEPLRWIGVNAGLAVMTGADWSEARTGRPSRVAKSFGRLLGQ